MAKIIKEPARAADELKQLFSRAHRAVFFGGAGVSVASGIPDFRSPNGLYHQKGFAYPPEVMLSHSFYETHRAEFFDFYRSMMCAPLAKPNQCYIKLAQLEREGHLRSVVTQNIDGLHQAAGSKRVWELHGSTHRNFCQTCHACYSQEWILATEGEPVCDVCHGPVKPDVVLYEEGLDTNVIAGAVRDISEADVLVIGGTSLVVYPAAGLINYFQGDTLVVCNLEATGADKRADVVLSCDIAQAFDF
ncbi:MAG: NAD-dependent protein deacylase [Atopobiaceae bacterium]|jgi:NAD-dependent deacetylase